MKPDGDISMGESREAGVSAAAGDSESGAGDEGESVLKLRLVRSRAGEDVAAQLLPRDQYEFCARRAG